MKQSKTRSPSGERAVPVEDSVMVARAGVGGERTWEARALTTRGQRSVGKSRRERHRTKPSGVSHRGAGISHKQMKVLCMWQKGGVQHYLPQEACLACASSLEATALRAQTAPEKVEGQWCPGG